MAPTTTTRTRREEERRRREEIRDEARATLASRSSLFPKTSYEAWLSFGKDSGGGGGDDEESEKRGGGGGGSTNRRSSGFGLGGFGFGGHGHHDDDNDEVEERYTYCGTRGYLEMAKVKMSTSTKHNKNHQVDVTNTVLIFGCEVCRGPMIRLDGSVVPSLLRLTIAWKAPDVEEDEEGEGEWEEGDKEEEENGSGTGSDSMDDLHSFHEEDYSTSRSSSEDSSVEGSVEG